MYDICSEAMWHRQMCHTEILQKLTGEGPVNLRGKQRAE